jgi:hypothetical protein
MNRLLILALALIIGSPDCWCCMVHQVQGKERSCCESNVASTPMCPMQRGAEHGGKSDPSQCPFIMSLRDATFVHVDAPAPQMTWAAPVWNEMQDLHRESAIRKALPFEDTGPPLERLPAFVRHHALLL